jgi:predicted component of type VI protein secretion system
MIPFPGASFGDEREERTVMVPVARMFLRATSGSLRAREFPFTGAPLVLGRAATCTISIPNHGVSRVHARVEYTDGDYWVIPEKTVNGTRVNGALVHEPTRLVENDQISIEDCNFVVTLRGPEITADEPLAEPPRPSASTVVVTGELHPAVRLSAPTIATFAAPPRYSEPMMAQPPMYSQNLPMAYPSAYAPNVPQFAYPPPSSNQRWLVIVASALGVIGLVSAVVVVTVKLVAPVAPVSPQVVAAPPEPVRAPAPQPVQQAVPAPTPPPPTPPAPAVAAAKPLIGIVAVDQTPIASGARGTLVDVVANGTIVDAGTPVAHVRADSAAYQQAYAKLVALQRKYGNSADYADFIAQARQDLAAVARRRELQPIVAPKRGSLALKIHAPGTELAARQALGDIVVARLTVPVAAVDGDGTHCVAKLASGKELAGTLLPIGSVERTLELDDASLEPGNVGELRVHCTQ